MKYDIGYFKNYRGVCYMKKIYLIYSKCRERLALNEVKISFPFKRLIIKLRQENVLVGKGAKKARIFFRLNCINT